MTRHTDRQGTLKAQKNGPFTLSHLDKVAVLILVSEIEALCRYMYS